MKTDTNKTYTKLTPEIRKRIKDLQLNKHSKDKVVAENLGLTIHQYKNIIRTSGGNKNISTACLNQMAQYYDCTLAYITCTSDEPDKNEKNEIKIHPISFADKPKMIDDIAQYLKSSDNETVFYLHTILMKLPRNTINSINSILKTLIKYSDDFKNNT